jgi:hypothetical protein
MGLEQVRDAPVEALHHAVRLGCPGPGQAMLDPQTSAEAVELILAAGITGVRVEQAVGERLGRCPSGYG